MSRRNTTRLGILAVLLIGFVLGYFVACSNNSSTKSVNANQDDNAKAGKAPGDGKKPSKDGKNAGATSSPVKPVAIWRVAIGP